MSISGDKYNPSTIYGIIKFLEEDMAGHINQIKRLNKSAIAYIDSEFFLKYVMDEIIKEYVGYSDSKKQYLSFVKVRNENEIEAGIPYETS